LDILIFETGWMEAICGPMFSGKSEELIRRLRRAAIARKRVQVFKPSMDTRYSECEIVTHADTRMRSEPVASAREILSKVDGRSEVIGIDESHFLGPDLTAVAEELTDDGKRVIIAGLDTDYMGRPFPPMPDLLALAESITKTLAICVLCGNPAKNSQRLVESGELILVGAAGAYEARCRRCFEPGVPKPGVMQSVPSALNGNSPVR
jgi:thymidine kinase